MSFKLLWPVFLLISLNSEAASIILQTKSATVWLPQQTITGKISGIAVIKLTWHLNNENGIINVKRDGSFSFSIILKSTNNIIWVEDEAHKVISDTINYTLGFERKPYSNRAIFKSGQSIQSLDSNNLFPVSTTKYTSAKV